MKNYEHFGRGKIIIPRLFRGKDLQLITNLIHEYIENSISFDSNGLFSLLVTCQLHHIIKLNVQLIIFIL